VAKNKLATIAAYRIMKTKHTGGPAFPLQSIGPEFDPGYSGMSLRDYFAARMMIRELGEELRPHQDYNYRNAAIRAYRMADAMLKAREAE
jgi:hypothetical protein